MLEMNYIRHRMEKGGVPTRKGVGKVCSLNVKRDGYRDSHEAGVFVNDSGILCLWTRVSHSNKGCSRANLWLVGELVREADLGIA